MHGQTSLPEETPSLPLSSHASSKPLRHHVATVAVNPSLPAFGPASSTIPQPPVANQRREALEISVPIAVRGDRRRQPPVVNRRREALPISVPIAVPGDRRRQPPVVNRRREALPISVAFNPSLLALAPATRPVVNQRKQRHPISKSRKSVMSQRKQHHPSTVARMSGPAVELLGESASVLPALAGDVGLFSEGQSLDELFDVLQAPPSLGILDQSSVKYTGVTKRRGDVHRDGTWHRSIHLWVVIPDLTGRGNDQLIFQKRALTKDTNPGLWDVSVAGHVDAGSAPLETVVREAQEELGFETSPKHLTHLFSIAAEARGATPKHGPYICREVQDVYLYSLTTGLKSIRYSTGEVADIRVEPLPHVLEVMRTGDARYVPRDAQYVEAFDSALTRLYPAA